MDIEIFLTPGLGDASYLIGSDGEAALVDPQRDVARFLHAADERGWRITHVLETHVHNDYLSGAMEVRVATGAEIVAPSRGAYRFPHRAADEGAAVAVGRVSLVAMATPGHTPEHLAWQIIGDGNGTPAAVLTGGSLLVGSAGRTDLLGAGLTSALTDDQFRSLRRLARLPDAVRVLPTHGAGSFCAAGPTSNERTSTMGEQRATNELLQTVQRGRFHRLLLDGLGRYPAYYGHMAEINRRGAHLLGVRRTPAALRPDLVAELLDRGIWVIDTRDRCAFAEGHVPGSIHVEGDDSFVGWVGSVVPFGAPIVLILPEGGGRGVAEELVVELSRIGYDGVVGVLDGGVDGWAATGRPVETLATTHLDDLARGLAASESINLLDVRQPTEWREGAVPGSTTIFLGDLPERIHDLDRGVPWVVACRSGARAAIAASLLAREGFRVSLVADGGIPDVLARLPVADQGTAVKT